MFQLLVAYLGTIPYRDDRHDLRLTSVLTTTVKASKVNHKGDMLTYLGALVLPGSDRGYCVA